MGSLKSLSDHLTDLKSEAQAIVEAARDLSALFDREETRLKRDDEASSLRAIHSAVVEQLQRLKEIEASASSGHSQAKLVESLAGLFTTAIVSKGDRLSAITDYLCRRSASKQPFGLVMVCIGPGGLPDDVGVVSISQLARESSRPQAEIMNRLRDDGYLLFSEEAFSALISRLIGDVRDGKLHLPVSRDRLVEIAESNKQKLRPKITRVE